MLEAATQKIQQLKSAVDKINEAKNINIDRMLIEKIDYTYNLEDLRIDQLSGTLNIGTIYGSESGHRTFEKAKKDMAKKIIAEVPRYNIKFK